MLRYLQHVTERFDLRKDMIFNCELRSAKWDDSTRTWTVETSIGDTFVSRYLVTGLGLLSKQNFPDIPGLKSFQGEMYHTGAWPKDATCKDKRVAILGNGSTGIQVITAIAKEVKQLYTFQRNPQYSVPSGDGPVDPEYRKKVNENYEQIWDQVKGSMFGFGFPESTKTTASVGEEERKQIFEEAWRLGNGFRFMFWTFCDISYDEFANAEAANFIKGKISETVKDPEKARKLMPSQHYARRPLCDAGYYEQFNRDNVDIISLKETPITEITPKGVKTSDGKEYEVDMIIFATGFDAVDGNYTRVAIQGRNGETLKDHWQDIGPTSYMGLAVANFPNLFMITGPNGPFCNIPPGIETHCEFISNIIQTAEKRKKEQAATNGDHVNGDRADTPVIEVKQEAEDGWTNMCDEMSKGSLFRKTDSWIFGANVPGKKHAVMFYFGGLASYREKVREEVEGGYKGFKPF